MVTFQICSANEAPDNIYTEVIDHLELLDRLLETLPGQKSAPAPEFSVTNPAEATNDQSPGDQGQ